MDEAGLDARAGFLKGRVEAQGILGLVPADWWVSWFLGPLVGRALSRGGCGLGGSQGSLSADGWACVPAQLVA